MDQSIELLQDVVKTARTGSEAIQLMMDKTEDVALRQSLFNEKQQFMAVEKEADEKLMQMGGQAKPEGVMNRAGMWMGVQMNTLTDKSANHVADLFIQGNNMGIIELTRTKNVCAEADQEATQLCDRMLRLQHDSIEHLKGFLS